MGRNNNYGHAYVLVSGMITRDTVEMPSNIGNGRGRCKNGVVSRTFDPEIIAAELRGEAPYNPNVSSRKAK